LLTLAGERLSDRGAAALSLRELAAAAGTSTTAVYALFGGKPGLLTAVHLEAFTRFRDQLRATPVTDDPLADLVALGLAYRANALANPHLFALMFDRPLPDMSTDVVAVADDAYATLRSTVQRGVDSGAFPAGSADKLTMAAWGLVHGLVALRLTGVGGEIDFFEGILRTTIDGWSNRREN
jgi:AcrR family transcriptional regulator